MGREEMIKKSGILRNPRYPPKSGDSGAKMTVLLTTARERDPAKLYLVILLLVIPALLISPVAAHPPSALNL